MLYLLIKDQDALIDINILIIDRFPDKSAF